MSGMSKVKPQYRRLLFIDEQIRTGRFPNCSTLAGQWEVSTKTIQRDLDYLRDELGAPLVYDDLQHGYRYENPAWFMPSIVLAEGDLLALLLGTQAMAMYKGAPVADELGRVFRKLADFLPEKISIEPEFVHTRFSFVNAPARPIQPEIWKLVVRGLLHQRIVDIHYRSRKATAAKKITVHPYHLVNLQGDWYLFAYNPKHDDIIQLALSRIESCVVTEARFILDPGFSMARILEGSFGKYVNTQPGQAVQVVVRFTSGVAGYIREKPWHPDQQLRALKDGSVELSLPVTDLIQIIPWILGFGADAEVLKPAPLRTRIREEIARMNDRYR